MDTLLDRPIDLFFILDSSLLACDKSLAANSTRSLFLATFILHDDLKIRKVLGLNNTCYGEQIYSWIRLLDPLLKLAT